HSFADCLGLRALWRAAAGGGHAVCEQAGRGCHRDSGAGEAVENWSADEVSCCHRSPCGRAQCFRTRPDPGASHRRDDLRGCVMAEDEDENEERTRGRFPGCASKILGSGYVLLAFLQSEFVERLHWLTEKQLIDAVAVGQFTPGPVFTTATFIGYIVAGIPGAVVATLGIFLPGFLLVAVSGPLIPKLRRSPMAGAVLDGVVVGSLALMAVVAWGRGGGGAVGWG